MDYAERIVKGHPRTEGMLSTLAGAALCAAVFVSGSMPADIAPVAHEVATVKPAKELHPDEDDCVPVAVHKHVSGAVHAEEDCAGESRYIRMDK